MYQKILQKNSKILIFPKKSQIIEYGPYFFLLFLLFLQVLRPIFFDPKNAKKLLFLEIVMVSHILSKIALFIKITSTYHIFNGPKIKNPMPRPIDFIVNITSKYEPTSKLIWHRRAILIPFFEKETWESLFYSQNLPYLSHSEFPRTSLKSVLQIWYQKNYFCSQNLNLKKANIFFFKIIRACHICFQKKCILFGFNSARIVTNAFDPKCCSEKLCSVFVRMDHFVFKTKKKN